MFGLTTAKAYNAALQRARESEAEARLQREVADNNRRLRQARADREFRAQTHCRQEIKELRELLDAAQCARDAARKATRSANRRYSGLVLRYGDMTRQRDTAERKHREALEELEQARRTVVLPAHGEVSYTVTLRPDDQITRVTNVINQRDDIANTFLRSRPD